MRPLPQLFRVSLIAAAIMAVVVAVLAEVTLKPRMVQLEAFQVVGTFNSTNNAKEAGPDAIIGKQWHEFLSRHLIDKIPDKLDNDVIAVYTDYADGGGGEYSFVLGARVKPTPNPTIPEGMIVKTVPGGRYAVFTTERGPLPKVVPDTWKQIWAYYKSPQNGTRAYQADFEVYDQRGTDPNSGQVDIYIGIK